MIKLKKVFILLLFLPLMCIAKTDYPGLIAMIYTDLQNHSIETSYSYDSNMPTDSAVSGSLAAYQHASIFYPDPPTPQQHIIKISVTVGQPFDIYGHTLCILEYDALTHSIKWIEKNSYQPDKKITCKFKALPENIFLSVTDN